MIFMYTIFFYFIVQLFCNYIDYCAADKYVKEENQIKIGNYFYWLSSDMLEDNPL